MTAVSKNTLGTETEWPATVYIIVWPESTNQGSSTGNNRSLRASKLGDDGGRTQALVHAHTQPGNPMKRGRTFGDRPDPYAPRIDYTRCTNVTATRASSVPFVARRAW